MHKKRNIINYFFNSLKNANDNYSGFNFESATSLTHCHMDFYEFILITDGEWIHNINNTNTILPMGTLLFYKPRTIHSIISKSSQSRHMVFGVEENYFNEYVKRVFPDFDLNSIDGYLSKPIHIEKRNYLEFLAKSISDNSVSRHILTDEALYSCLSDFMYLTKTTDKNIYVADIIQQLNNYTYLNYSVKDICNLYPLSQPILLNLFKATTGITIVQYKMQKKLEYACELLKYSTTSISNIALHLQYDSLSYFTRLFKKSFGMSPTEYRKKYSTLNSDN